MNELTELNQVRFKTQVTSILLDHMVHTRTTRDQLADHLGKDREHVDQLLSGNGVKLDDIADAFLVFQRAAHIRLVVIDKEQPKEEPKADP